MVLGLQQHCAFKTKCDWETGQFYATNMADLSHYIMVQRHFLLQHFIYDAIFCIATFSMDDVTKVEGNIFLIFITFWPLLLIFLSLKTHKNWALLKWPSKTESDLEGSFTGGGLHCKALATVGEQHRENSRTLTSLLVVITVQHKICHPILITLAICCQIFCGVGGVL